jgi:Acetyl/propionyl-CoA carboxylase, alpha subunit
MKKLRVTIEGKVYEVLVEILDQGTPVASAPSPVAAPVAAAPAPAPAPVAQPAAAPAPAAAPVAAGAGSLTSPLAGKVVSIDVKAGQQVAEGDQVLTIEAMKMNTYVYAHKAGTIGAIHVAAGDGVEEGQALVEIA